MKVWIEGQIVDGEQARTPVLDHGLLYGDGIFEGIRAHAGKPFRLDDHLRRLAHGARALHLELPPLVQLRQVVRATLDAHGGGTAYIRLIVTRGVGALGVDPSSCDRPRVICIVGELHLFSDADRARGVSMITSSLRRPAADVLDPRIKSLNYLNNVMAKAEAKRLGADEALMLNGAGQVAEASVANVFAARDGILLTPPTTDGALEGMTRRTVLELAAERGLSCQVRTMGRMDLMSADEVFLTGTGAGIVRVRELDGELIGSGEPGPLFSQLTDAYREAVAAA